MSEWRETTLAELASPDRYALATGPFGSAISAKHFVEEGVPVLRGSNLSLDVGVRLIDEGLAFLEPDKAATFTRSMAHPGDLVFTCWGTVGQVGLIDDRAKFEEYVVSNKQMKLTPDPAKVDSLFLYYLLSSAVMLAEVQGQSIGAAVPGFNLGQLRSIRVRIPPVVLQRRIARLLGDLDDLIDNNRRRIELLEQMAQAIYREWFVRFRYPGHEDVPLVDSPLGPMPDDWDVKPFAELASFVNGFAFKPEHWGRTGRPIIKIRELKHGVTTDTPRCDMDVVADKYLVESGDLLFSWSADLGTYRWSDEPGLLNQHLFTVIPVPGLSLAFMFRVLDRAMPEFRDRAQGTTMRHIKRAALSEVSTAVPPQRFLDLFTDAVEPIDQQVISLRGANQRLASIRDLLLPKLVTGQVDVSNLDLDEFVDSVA